MNSYFVKRTHININIYFVCVFIMFFSMALLFCIRFPQYIATVLMLLLLLYLIFYYVTKLFNHCGMYIENDNLYYKKLKKKIVVLDDIKGIKVIKAAITNGYWSTSIKSKDGKEMYTMIFLKDITEQMREYQSNDIGFLTVYSENVLFQTVYDEYTIKFIKKRKPDVKII